MTKTFLPPREEYQRLLDRIWDSGQVTNGGELLLELESRLRHHLDVPHLQVVTNGTLAIQLSLRALGVSAGEVITTPFSYVATTSAILWEGCTPVFADIDPRTLNIDPARIEAAVTPATRAIVAVHVFGVPCDTEAIEGVAAKHGLPVVYDGAHAFGVQYQGRSLLGYGDITTCSFHATKLFHTIEGGCVIARSPQVDERLDLVKRFGHTGDDHVVLGTNAKANEFQAAMGLVNLPYVSQLIEGRRRVCEMYDRLLPAGMAAVSLPERTVPNYSYYPVLMSSEMHLRHALAVLHERGIHPRRYFFPSLNLLPYLEQRHPCPVSEDVAQRVLCLPLYPGLSERDVATTCDVLHAVERRLRRDPAPQAADRSGRPAANALEAA